jgi:hypothetical protein
VILTSCPKLPHPNLFHLPHLSIPTTFLSTNPHPPTVITSTNLTTAIMNRPSKGSGFKWDAAAERDLFAACLVAADEPKGATLSNAMDILRDNFGERFTQKAASHRL